MQVVDVKEKWRNIIPLIRAIEPEKMNQTFIDRVNVVLKGQGSKQTAIDSKTLRHSYQGNHGSVLHNITTWSKQQGLVQMKSLDKKSEKVSVLVLLDTLHINGALISVDAMNTQKKIADKIINRGAYVLCVKNNHCVLRNEVAAYLTKVSATTRNT
ncbi:ISAs1 family transposase [Salmonella enterica subsp. diarizonae serovar 48:i:z]|uniref:ISAs1 family transposase n=2 Tax=Salmonella enterica TaxID=28901 RepID=A0A7U6BEM2_SALDZ|nr:ISAs1 family transposase [Salmonella enterica subsp. diarizonae serovar 48:i:z]EAA4452010.1 ISAs1 family transposase [Salmonella enterica subsp. diarizonae]EAM2673023.1 ISAs1 family transposase [Salmonella enterica]EDW6116912.1 ISAs1 family transposase [Salmonella enterica subsp. salamae]EAM6404576.1 ISAs1 family transposase [Salmonella enterica]